MSGLDRAADAAGRAATGLALGLAAARVASGVVETAAPRLFLEVLGTPGAVTDGAALGFRMKGGRDLAMGVVTLAAVATGDLRTVAGLTAAGLVVDTVDGAAVHLDGGRSLRRPVHPLGAWLGYVVGAGAGVAGVVLGRASR